MIINQTQNIMKKINVLLLITALVIGSFSTANAQDEDKKKGIRAGWNYSNYYTNGEASGDNLNAFYVGFFTEKKIVPLLRFGTGLEYLQNGVSTDLNGTTLAYKAHAISIPLYLRVKLGPVFAQGGAGLNFNIAHNYKIGDESTDVPDELKVNTFDLPLHLGLGVKIAIITIEARYHWGMINVYDNLDTKSQYFQIGAGISF